MRLITGRNVRCTLLCIGRHISVRSPCCKATHFSARPGPAKFDRRRGFSTRVTAFIFVTTVIDFLLYSVTTGNQVALFIVLTRKAILEIDYPMSEKQDLVHKAVRNYDLILFWAGTPPVSINCRYYRIPYLLIPRGDLAQRSHYHLEGLGPLSRATVGSPRTVYSVDWGRG